MFYNEYMGMMHINFPERREISFYKQPSTHLDNVDEYMSEGGRISCVLNRIGQHGGPELGPGAIVAQGEFR